MISQVANQRLQERTGLFPVVVGPEMGADKGPDQPAPDGALVIGTIALPPITTIVADVGRIIGSETAQTVRGEQMAGADVYHSALLLLG